MEALLGLYAKPYDPREPVLCFDEKSKALRADTRDPIPATKHAPRRRDYEYRRSGTANIFLAVEPKGGFRALATTRRRTKGHFAGELKRIAALPRYRSARTLHVVLDNLNTHFASSLYETFPEQEAQRLLQRIQFHYTPKHASWLNMAEIELSILSRQALLGRIPTRFDLAKRLGRWQCGRNKARAMIQWTFTKKDARNVFKYKATN